MRLINVRTYTLEEFFDGYIPHYAILSHTWETEEVLFKDMRNFERVSREKHDLTIGGSKRAKHERDLEAVRRKRGFRKIECACTQALADRLGYVWIDTCCIDKSSSAELQEAINAMYKWYANAEGCYVFLSDMLGSCPILSDNGIGKENQFSISYSRLEPGDELFFWHRAFSDSKWFTRGWTLQELIAPMVVRFFGVNWNYIGDRARLADTIAKSTGIETEVLSGARKISALSVVRKMSWAANRKTSRPEDQAYSLLGLFGVNMPMLYGEGQKAFLRLQQQIMRQTRDQSILAWVGNGRMDSALLAGSPEDFASKRSIVPYATAEVFEVTDRGLRIQLPVIQPRITDPDCLAILHCKYEDDLSEVLALPLKPYMSRPGYRVSQKLLKANEGTDWKATSRLEHLKFNDIENAQMKLIEITWELEEENLDPRTSLWLQISGQATIESVYCGEFGYGKSCKYNSQSALSEPLLSRWTSMSLRALVTCHSGRRFSVVFGSHKPDPTSLRNLVIWLGPEDETDSSRLSRNRALQRTGQYITTQTSFALDEHAIARADVSLARILEEDVVRCMVDVSECYELM